MYRAGGREIRVRGVARLDCLSRIPTPPSALCAAQAMGKPGSLKRVGVRSAKFVSLFAVGAREYFGAANWTGSECVALCGRDTSGRGPEPMDLRLAGSARVGNESSPAQPTQRPPELDSAGSGTPFRCLSARSPNESSREYG